GCHACDRRKACRNQHRKKGRETRAPARGNRFAKVNKSLQGQHFHRFQFRNLRTLIGRPRLSRTARHEPWPPRPSRRFHLGCGIADTRSLSGAERNWTRRHCDIGMNAFQSRRDGGEDAWGTEGMQDLSPFQRVRISTADFPEHKRLETWREVYGRGVTNCDIEPIHDIPFRADVSFSLLPDVTIVAGARTPATYRVTRELAGRGRDVVALSILRSGAATATQF